VGGVIAKRESLLLISPEAFEKRMGIDVRVKNEALSIDRAAKKVKIRNHISGEDYFESYDKLIIATGSRPALPSIPVAAGLKLETLWNIEDMDKMLAT
jgi:NADPH-dependent 2,4-dienoyl-CoA reductase/sulfur reductase-like enzyme